MGDTREKIEFATNIPVEVTLGKNFKSGTGQYGNWHGWNAFQDGKERVIFAKDALHEKIKDYGEGSKLTITYAERKGADGKPFHEWQVSNGDAPKMGEVSGANLRMVPIPFERELNLEAHLLACADIANKIAEKLGITDDQARQATFATVTIDAQRHNVILSDSGPSDASISEIEASRKEALLKGVKSACKLLNDEGYEPRFTPKKLDEFVAESFDGKGLKDLSADDTEYLIQLLSEKLDNFRLNKSIDSEPDEDFDF